MTAFRFVFLIFLIAAFPTTALAQEATPKTKRRTKKSKSKDQQEVLPRWLIPPPLESPVEDEGLVVEDGDWPILTVRGWGVPTWFSGDVESGDISNPNTRQLDYKNDLGIESPEIGVKAEITLRWSDSFTLRADSQWNQFTGSTRVRQDFQFEGTLFLTGDQISSRVETQQAAVEFEIILIDDDEIRLGVPVGTRWQSVRTRIRRSSFPDARESQRTSSLYLPSGGLSLDVHLGLGVVFKIAGRAGLFTTLSDSGGLYAGMDFGFEWAPQHPSAGLFLGGFLSSAEIRFEDKSKIPTTEEDVDVFSVGLLFGLQFAY